MLTQKQNVLEIIKKGGKPDRLSNCYNPFKVIGDDPLFRYTRANRVRGTDSVDRWGTFITFPEDQPAAVPLVTEENQVIKDIESWRDYVKVPDLRANCSTGWEDAIKNKAAIDKSEYFSMSVLGCGLFEQLHALMLFEDSLCNFLMYPDETHELIEAITEYKLEYMKLLVENCKPDAVLSHDDFGSKHSLFMSPDTWREFFKEPYRKLYSYLRENDVLVMHHSDSFCEPIVEDMAEIGIQIWQGALPSNDINALVERLDGRMTLMGGIDSIIDRDDASEEEIRAEVRRACDTYGKLPHFMPSYTYGGPGTIFPNVEPIIIDEINKFNKEHFGV